jgi:hypothetical protein
MFFGIAVGENVNRRESQSALRAVNKLPYAFGDLHKTQAYDFVTKRAPVW